MLHSSKGGGQVNSRRRLTYSALLIGYGYDFSHSAEVFEFDPALRASTHRCAVFLSEIYEEGAFLTTYLACVLSTTFEVDVWIPLAREEP